MKIDKNIYIILKSLERSMSNNSPGYRIVNNEDLKISEEKWSQLIGLMQEEKLIKGYEKRKYVDLPYSIYLDVNPSITQHGRSYLKENSLLVKASSFAKEAKILLLGL